MGGGDARDAPQVTVAAVQQVFQGAESMEAVALAKQGQEAESMGFKDVACDKYREAAKGLIDMSQRTQDPSEISALTLQAGEYLERCNQLCPPHTSGAGQHAGLMNWMPRFTAFRASLGAQEPAPAPSESGPREAVPTALPSQPVPGGDDARGDSFSESEIQSGASIMGAGIGSILGSVLGVPVLGGVAGFFTAGQLVKQQDDTGAHARNLGMVGARVIRRGKSLNEEYAVTEKAKEAVSTAYEKGKELNERHDLTGKAAEAGKAAYRKAKEINDEYHVADRVAQAAGTALQGVTSVLGGSNQQQPEGRGGQPPAPPPYQRPSSDRPES